LSEHLLAKIRSGVNNYCCALIFYHNARA
jgi:hypothetical protein